MKKQICLIFISTICALLTGCAIHYISDSGNEVIAGFPIVITKTQNNTIHKGNTEKTTVSNICCVGFDANRM